MKDPDIVSFSPMFHLTDQKIRVHSFYCVIALMIARLMAARPNTPGSRSASPNCSTPWPASKKPCCSTKANAVDPALDEYSPKQTPPNNDLYDLFDLDTYAPKR